MADSSYHIWISLYDDEIRKIYNEEKAELRTLGMIYTAFQKELTKIKQNLSTEYAEIKTKIEHKKPGELPKLSILGALNEKNEIPETELFTLKSPTIATNRLSNLRNRKSTSPQLKSFSKPQSKLLYRKDDKERTTPICDTTNLIDCSIVETTPIKTKKSFIKNSRLKAKKKKARQNTTLTQMFGSPPKRNRTNEPDSNLNSMGIEEMLDYINKNDTIANKENKLVDDSCDSDETIEGIGDDTDSTIETEIAAKPNQSLLRFAENYNKLPEKKVVEPNEIVRGKARKKLKGWSCKDCENFYKNLNLSPDELAKKMDECSRHRHQFEREETMPGFWNLTFDPTQKTPDKDEESLVFHYRR